MIDPCKDCLVVAMCSRVCEDNTEYILEGIMITRPNKELLKKELLTLSIKSYAYEELKKFIINKQKRKKGGGR